MKEPGESLESSLRGYLNEKGSPQPEKKLCCYCRRELNLREHYQSPSGGKYCDKECFKMFTED